MRYEELKTPSYIVQERELKKNLEILEYVRKEAGCRILLAQKAFSMFRVYPLIAKYLDGTTSSGIFEAKLAAEEFAADSAVPENHVFEPAYKQEEMRDVCEICTQLYFNSLSQLEAHRPIWEPYQKAGKLQVALRINPEFSTQEGHAIYDPCAPGSRLGIRRCQMPEKLPEGVTGLHFHTLCEQGVEPLIDTFRSIEEHFSGYLKQVSWINMGGGHHITREDYDVECLIRFIREIREKWHLEVILEPGEAIALHAGTLITRVLDVVDTSDLPTLILDASAACHMPDVLEMPYTPPLFGAQDSGWEAFEKQKKMDAQDGSCCADVWVRLASRTCLAGDVIGVYKLPDLPKIDDILTFGDMAIYSMVKNNTFNGMALPDIVLERDTDEEDRFEIVKRFSYRDFKERLS